MEIRFEAWTRPETATFERRFPITPVVDWKLQLGLFGFGILVVPADYPRLGDLLTVDAADHTNDVATLIRAYVGDNWLFDFYAARVSIDVNETGTRVATITGRTSALDTTRVRQFDYPTNPSVEPDWRYGYGPELVSNGTFEDEPGSIQNPGAEDGTTLGWYSTGDPVTLIGVPNSFKAVQTEHHSGTWSFEVQADNGEGVLQEFPTVEGASYPVEVWVKAAAGVTYKVEVLNATAASPGTLFNGAGYVNGVGTGSWVKESVTIIADAGGSSAIQITSRQTAATFYFDGVTVVGYGIGTEPWKARGSMSLFEVSSSFAHSGTYSLKWKPSSGILGNDKAWQTLQVKPGSRVHASAWVYHTEAAARDFRIVILQPGVDPNVSNIASVLVSVPPSTWTELNAGGVSQLPTVEVEVRWDETGNPTNDLYLDDVSVHQGTAAATAGKILNDLLAAATAPATRNALAHLTPTFSDTADSNGDPWDRNISITIKRGQTYRRVVELLASRYGYEMRIRANPADDTVLWFDVYNPDGMGTDYSATDGGAVTASGVVSVGPLIRREPQAVYAMIEGDGQEWGEALNTTLQTAWGDLETYDGATELSVGTLATIASGLTTGASMETVVAKMIGPDLIPGVDYNYGDVVYVIVGDDLLPAGTYRVVDIAVESGDPEPMFQVQFEPSP